MTQHIPRIIQFTLAVPLAVFTVLNWHHNELGQNIINITAVLLLVMGFDRILIPYRWYKNSQSIEYEGTFLVGFLMFVGRIFEKFHPSQFHSNAFNSICFYAVVVVLVINIGFILFILVVIICYTIRQIYRLITETLLSANQNFQTQQLQQLLNSAKTYKQIHEGYPAVNNQCSICLLQFQPQSECILLPGCRHCFHSQCIQGWLQNRATCPYCRNNIRVSAL